MKYETKHYTGMGKPVTPWGRADTCTIFDNGIKFYSTPSHGGFFVPKQLRQAILPYCLDAMTSSWYEEDCEALKVYMAFPTMARDNEHLESIKQAYAFWFNERGEYKAR